MSCCRFLDYLDKLFWEVDRLGKGFEFGGDLLGKVPGFLECVAKCVDVDLREDGFDGCLSIEQDLHVVRILHVLDQRSLCQYFSICSIIFWAAVSCE